MEFSWTWILRLSWLVVGPTTALAVSEAIEGASRPVIVTLAIGAWAGWLAGLIATLVPAPVTLTLVRLAGPGALALAGWAALVGPAGPVAVVALVAASAAAVLGWSAEIGDRFVDASSYGAERRLLLRIPVRLALGPVPLTVLISLAGISVGPLLLADRRWLLGALALLIGLPLAVLAALALHRLSQRWLVIVPAGLVIHDRLLLLDAVLCRSDHLVEVSAARADTEAVDLSGGCIGYALEVALREPVSVVRAPLPGRSTNPPVDIERLLVAPVRPGRALALAAA